MPCIHERRTQAGQVELTSGSGAHPGALLARLPLAASSGSLGFFRLFPVSFVSSRSGAEHANPYLKKSDKFAHVFDKNADRTVRSGFSVL